MYASTHSTPPPNLLHTLTSPVLTPAYFHGLVVIRFCAINQIFF